MSFSEVLGHTSAAYKRNWKLLAFFSLPFAILFPLSLLLPNFVALGGIFLRYGSIQQDLSVYEALFISAVFLASLFLFSFALVAINLIIKSQRTLLKLTHYELERMEVQTFKLFSIFLLVFILSLLVNLFLYDQNLNSSVGLLFSFIISLAVIFAPQAIVIDDLGFKRSIQMSLRVSLLRFPFLLSFLAVAAAIVLFLSFVFIQLQTSFQYSNYLNVLVNAIIVLPFLEVLKTQIYLSKYTLL